MKTDAMRGGLASGRLATLVTAVLGPLALGACGNGTEPTPLPRPTFTAATVTSDTNNVLTALVSAHTQDADSVIVRFHLAGASGADSTTPAIRVVDDSVSTPVLGLLPERRYVLRMVGYGPGGTGMSDSLEFTTGALPADLPRYTASGGDPTAGYVVFAAGSYGIVIDNTGRIVWYRRFAEGAGLNFVAGANGRYLMRPPNFATGVTPWIEIDVAGDVTRTFACANGLQTRFHDILVEADGGYWIMCDESRPMDLSALGGRADAIVDGTAVQHIGPTGNLLFQWSPFDHFQITDLEPSQRTGARVNWMHGNAIDRDGDGNLLLSFRSLNEVAKVNATTGAVMWRMGGLRNEFTYTGLAGSGFARQHGLRANPQGGFMLLDNTGNPAESRAEHYVVDAAAHTAQLVRSYGSTPAVVTQIGGSMQPLANGRAMVSFGTEGRVEEYNLAGQLLWHIEGNPGYVFRAQRIASLYTPGVGTTR
jgi:hypothetical protein